MHEVDFFLLEPATEEAALHDTGATVPATKVEPDERTDDGHGYQDADDGGCDRPSIRAVLRVGGIRVGTSGRTRCLRRLRAGARGTSRGSHGRGIRD